MVRKIGAALLSCLLFINCSGSASERNLSINGEWIANSPTTSYIALNFNKMAVFDNRGDTINIFSYYVDYPTHTLWLTDAFAETRSAKILKLTADSLVFAQLWDLKTAHHFHKSKKYKK